MTWSERRTYGAESVPTVTAMRARKDATQARVAVIVTAGPGDSTVHGIRAAIETELVRGASLIDDLVVADTPDGRGDALWRSIAATPAQIAVWLDGGMRNFSPRFVVRMLAPLLLEDSLLMVKGFASSKISPKSGGRAADHGLARPLLAAHFPRLVDFAQPFSREGAARVALLRRLAFVAGEAVDAGLLIDSLEVAGLDALGQAEFGSAIHRTDPVSRYDIDIARTILRRAEEWGRTRPFADAPVDPLLVRDQQDPVPDRPPLDGRHILRPAGRAPGLARVGR
ncbi:MAG TPA: hypothetical protein VGB64_11770 [Actinomycetota bacterium]